MDLDGFCQEIKDRFPEISAKADRWYTLRWDDLTDTEYYSYSWFEALANALNGEMRKETDPALYGALLKVISNAFESEGAEIAKAIDVAFVENLFWEVPEHQAASYWAALPRGLKELYVNFHHRTPL
ncbi:DUF7674 family protein [Thiosocius teredinicola]|uniref:DUF7674 family protein n=1 Tax=Thiosocius teredinicola TaxID=1973002 RepID=UPI0009913E90